MRSVGSRRCMPRPLAGSLRSFRGRISCPIPTWSLGSMRETCAVKSVTALKVGCGLGDDAEELSRREFLTTAFDISSTAISWCQHRFPGSSVDYVATDLLRPPDDWAGRFDFVVESYTLQVLTPALRRNAVRQVAGFVAPGGTLLVIARGREPSDPEGTMPCAPDQAGVGRLRGGRTHLGGVRGLFGRRGSAGT